MAVFRIDARHRRPLLCNDSAKKHNDGGHRSSAQKSICPEFSEQYARAMAAEKPKKTSCCRALGTQHGTHGTHGFNSTA